MVSSSSSSTAGWEAAGGGGLASEGVMVSSSLSSASKSIASPVLPVDLADLQCDEALGQALTCVDTL